MSESDTGIKWLVIENIIIYLISGAIIVFAPDGWKWAGIILCLFVNFWNTKKKDD